MNVNLNVPPFDLESDRIEGLMLGKVGPEIFRE